VTSKARAELGGKRLPGTNNRLASQLELPALWQDVECGSYSADLPLWRELVASAAIAAGRPSRLLELGSGTGRVSLALAGRDCVAVALESDPRLVAALRSRASERQLPVRTLVADARSFELDERFDLVLAPMQLAQLLLSSKERRAMLRCIAQHLALGGRAALALLEPEEDWGAGAGSLPIPDMLEKDDGWVYSSQPRSVRRVDAGRSLQLDRIRAVVSPGGEQVEILWSERLALFGPEDLEGDARLAGLVPEPRRAVPATSDHVASTVVVLRASPRE